MIERVIRSASYSTELNYYFAPQPETAPGNDYIQCFYETLAGSVSLINYRKKPGIRAFDFVRYGIRADVMILNWPEDILNLKFGLAQQLVACVAVGLFRLTGGKVVWVCHNKESHYKSYPLLRKLAYNFFKKAASHVVVHSKNALDFFPPDKALYLPHPAYPFTPRHMDADAPVDTDILIWGSISRYKGLEAFIAAYKKRQLTFRTVIIGRGEEQYVDHLRSQCAGTDIRIENRFLESEDLYQQFSRTRIILLPYLPSDTFSSGALIHSLNAGRVVIGPAIGNFIDVGRMGACLVYDTDDALFLLIGKLLSDEAYYDSVLATCTSAAEAYRQQYNWQTFTDELVQHI